MNQGARFPQVAAKAGHYESFYIKACRPGGGQGIWIRHTVHKRPGAEPNASIWFVLFDREADGPRATKVTVPATELSAPAGSWIKIDGAEVGPGRAAGAIDTDAVKASWDFTFSGDAEPCKYLPSDRLYETRLPKTKFVAPFPNARFDGRLEVDGEVLELNSWPGMIGHNWGTEHAERWVWLEGTGFEGSPDTYFDAGAARIKLGPWTTPWIPSGMLMLDAKPHRLGGFGQIRGATIEESPGSCSFVLPGKDIVVRGKVSAPKKDFVGWVYADPKGPEHHTINCSAADLELTVERPALPPLQLSLPAGAAYELGMHETDHGIPVQP
ncbi:MAG TPA: hypothetical protein VN756_10570, partial [Solirubrobacterales bacterium]|nr:hypothetical protein [Solirubrobacterales bacterium]